MTRTKTQPVTLATVLAYRHPGVVRRYMKEHNASASEAREVFRGMLKWLYLCYRSSDAGIACAMTPELEKIDWMWHAFVLFTIDYAQFCERYFGFFLHHVPNAEDDDDVVARADSEESRSKLEQQLGLVYDVLGRRTLTDWYDCCKFAVAPVVVRK